MAIPSDLEILSMAPLPQFLALMASDPQKAAEILEYMASQFLHAAGELRKGNVGEVHRLLKGPDGGGLTDRVLARVVGPDGQVKQETDTHKRD